MNKTKLMSTLLVCSIFIAFIAFISTIASAAILRGDFRVCTAPGTTCTIGTTYCVDGKNGGRYMNCPAGQWSDWISCGANVPCNHVGLNGVCSGEPIVNYVGSDLCISTYRPVIGTNPVYKIVSPTSSPFRIASFRIA